MGIILSNQLKEARSPSPPGNWVMILTVPPYWKHSPKTHRTPPEPPRSPCPNGISPQELEAALAAASTELHETTGKLKAVESTLREKKDLQKQLLAYIKTKPARDWLKAQKTEKARRAYREQHESEFIISESAARR